MKDVKRSFLLAVAAVGAVLGGCNAGMAPEGMSEKEVQSAFEKMSTKDKIDFIERSPMPPDQKKKRIEEIRAQGGG